MPAELQKKEGPPSLRVSGSISVITPFPLKSIMRMQLVVFTFRSLEREVFLDTFQNVDNAYFKLAPSPLPPRPFISRFQSHTVDFSELGKIGRSTDFHAPKLWNVRSGYLFACLFGSAENTNKGIARKYLPPLKKVMLQ